MSKSKKSKAKQTKIPLSPETYIRKKARTLPLFECIINSEWKDEGLATIIVARKHVNGNLTLGLYLVDLYCLGVKDSFYKFNISQGEYENIKDEFYENLTIKTCNYVLAHNIIYGAVEYADELGFKPDKDFLRLTVNILEEDDERIELMDIEFGLNGKPCLVTNPENNYKREIAHLEKTVGPGNYQVIYLDSDDFYRDDYPENGHDSQEDAFDEDEIDEDANEAYTELESLKNWTDKDWKDFSNGKKKLSEKASLLLTDLVFYSQYEKVEVDKVFEEMESLLDIEISTEPLYSISEMKTHFKDEKLIQQLQASYVIANEGNPKRAIQLIRQLIEHYPDNQILYNNLVIYYTLAGKKRKAEDIIIYFYQKFPDYLFAKVHYSLFLISRGKEQEVPKVLKNMWTLPELLPNRKVFHYSEVIAFHILLISYYLKTDEILKADTLFKVLSQYGFDDVAESHIMFDLQLAKIMSIKGKPAIGPDEITDGIMEKNYLKVVRKKAIS